MAFIYNMVDTWNSGGTTFTAIKMNVTDTDSAAASLLMDLQVGSVSKVSITKAGKITTVASGQAVLVENGSLYAGAGFQVGNGGTFEFSNGATFNPILRADSAGVLAQRDGTNAQTFRVYGSYTDGSNNDFIQITKAAGGNCEIQTKKNGTGVEGDLILGTGTQNRLAISSGSGNIVFNTNIVAASDGAYDIGSGSADPRKLYLDQTITAGGTTGNQTINKAAGTVNIAAAGTTVTVTNNLVTTSSLVFAVIRTNDATARIANVVPAAGSFTINLTAAATGEISIGFWVLN